MRVDILNNWKYKGPFSNGLYLSWGRMFPWPSRRYIKLGLFGFIVVLQFGDLK